MPYARKPTITVEEHSRFHMKFSLSHTDVSVANAIRRAMIAEVPTMAIDLVEVHDNTSPLADEYLVHRLGLIPLYSHNTDRFEYGRDCDNCDDHCHKCSVVFRLQVTAPGDGQVVRVTSRDLMSSRPEEHKDDSIMQAASELDWKECERVTPVHNSGDEKVHTEDSEDGILIARLVRGQVIDMTAIARKGIAKDHAKWSPMCTVAYRIVPPQTELLLDRLNDLLTLESRKELQAASSGLVSVDDHTGNLYYETPFLEGRIAVTADAVRKAGQLAEAAGGKLEEVVRYNPVPERFDFKAETTGAVAPIDSLRIAVRIIAAKLGDLQSHSQ